MSVTFRPALRQNTPLIIGLAGPTKSGKTMSALRLAVGLANGGPIAMINAEGPRGHQYAERFHYLAAELAAPYRPMAYTDALKAAAAARPSVVIIDSTSHMHDGPGGVLEWHEELLDDMAGTDQGKRQRATFAAWVKPKAAENEFIYQLLSMRMPVILALRAKEKLKIVGGKPVELGWQPIVGERIAFETMFTLMLPPHAKGIPDLALSDMREPFDTMIPADRPLDETTGQRLAAWASGTDSQLTREPDREGDKVSERDPRRPETSPPQRTGESGAPVARESSSPGADRAAMIAEIKRRARDVSAGDKVEAAQTYLGGLSLDKADVAQLSDLLGWLKARTV